MLGLDEVEYRNRLSLAQDVESGVRGLGFTVLKGLDVHVGLVRLDNHDDVSGTNLDMIRHKSARVSATW